MAAVQAAEPGQVSEPGPAADAVSINDVVLAAMTTDMAAPDGQPIDASASSADGLTEVSYRRGEVEVARRTFRVSGTTVWLEGFTVTKYHTGQGLATALHERFVANLRAGRGRYLLRATLSDVSARAWIRHYDWAPDMASATAVNLRTAVEQLHGLLRRQSVWDAEGLPERVQLIGGPDPALGTGSWRHLIATTTPASLYDGLEALREGLGNAVFLSISAWHGSRAVTGSKP